MICQGTGSFHLPIKNERKRDLNSTLSNRQNAYPSFHAVTANTLFEILISWKQVPIFLKTIDEDWLSSVSRTLATSQKFTNTILQYFYQYNFKIYKQMEFYSTYLSRDKAQPSSNQRQVGTYLHNRKELSTGKQIKPRAYKFSSPGCPTDVTRSYYRQLVCSKSSIKLKLQRFGVKVPKFLHLPTEQQQF